jgi:uncharacterized membrane protein YhaH (DUF805 family)
MGIVKFLFGFNGRVGRLAYFLGTFGFAISGLLILLALGLRIGVKNQDPIISTVEMVLNLASLLNCCALGTKRFHDLNKSGWWLFASIGAFLVAFMLTALVPALGVFAIGGVGLFMVFQWIQLLFFKGDAGSNDYGNPPDVMKQLRGDDSTADGEPAWVAQAMSKTTRTTSVRTAVNDANTTVVTRVARSAKISGVTGTTAPAGFGRRNR